MIGNYQPPKKKIPFHPDIQPARLYRIIILNYLNSTQSTPYLYAMAQDSMSDENSRSNQFPLLGMSREQSQFKKIIWDPDGYDREQELQELAQCKIGFEKIYFKCFLGRQDSLCSQFEIEEKSIVDGFYTEPSQASEPESGQSSSSRVHSPTRPVAQNQMLPPPLKSNAQKKKFYDKSFCRYIILYAFRALEREEYWEFVEAICLQNGAPSQLFKDYYIKQRTVIMGYQLLKNELIINHNDAVEVVNRKKAFQDYMKFYLDRLATKDILRSKKQDLQGYLNFKNFVMSYYVRRPREWCGNKPEWRNLLFSGEPKVPDPTSTCDRVQHFPQNAEISNGFQSDFSSQV